MAVNRSDYLRQFQQSFNVSTPLEQALIDQFGQLRQGAGNLLEAIRRRLFGNGSASIASPSQGYVPGLTGAGSYVDQFRQGFNVTTPLEAAILRRLGML